MVEDEETSQQEPLPVQDPMPVVPIVPDYLRASDEFKLVTLCRMPLMEAEMAKNKLESEGIHAYITDQSMAVTEPWVITQVRVQVREGDAAEAQEILARPAEDDGQGEYADEEWRCPKCHRKGVELVPLPVYRRRLRALSVVLVLLPIVFGLSRSMVERELARSMLRIQEDWIVPYLVGVLLLCGWLMLYKRTKRCPHCGHEWLHVKGAHDEA